MALKSSCFGDSLQNWPRKFLKKRNLTAIPLILVSGIRSIKCNLNVFMPLFYYLYISLHFCGEAWPHGVGGGGEFTF